MRIIVFNGSPRAGGNVETLLSEATRPIEAAGHEVTRFRLNDMSIRPCQECGGCDRTGACVVKDDMGVIADAIRSAERFILGSPVFFFGLSAQTKAMIDRCQAFWCEKYVLKRPIDQGPAGRKGLLILVGGMRKEIGVKCGGETATAFFRTISVPEHETVSFLGVDRKGAIREHATALPDVFAAGRRLVGLDEGR